MKYNISDVNELLQNRRTIYPEQYTEREVDREIIEAIINNATWAPTHGLTQPWRFKVFTGDSLQSLGQFQAELYKSTVDENRFVAGKYQKYKERPSKASAIIAVCMKRQESGKIPEVEEMAAVACAIQNMHLTATAYGVGAFWSTGAGMYKQETSRFLGLQGEDKCVAFFYLGYPDIDWPKRQRKPLDSLTQWLAG
ncbi:nitroreductase family protein [Thalassomonas haliotis]|uniref:Putative NAD(P)H nitroreductase n=1 Tax=Thalassomonas haliotis TaxID=485448 RepID=A0ABY7VF17_9GAMM|nr:nitroreductase [Thalassomonas haliotis]WDE11991.1 nitroreductase [Thalassomonas haliotis]